MKIWAWPSIWVQVLKYFSHHDLPPKNWFDSKSNIFSNCPLLCTARNRFCSSQTDWNFRHGSQIAWGSKIQHQWIVKTAPHRVTWPSMLAAIHCCRTYSFPCVASHLFTHKNCDGQNQKIKQRPFCLITYVWWYQSLCDKAFMFYHDITNWGILSVSVILCQN